jgi:hypothetical protein
VHDILALEVDSDMATLIERDAESMRGRRLPYEHPPNCHPDRKELDARQGYLETGTSY